MGISLLISIKAAIHVVSLVILLGIMWLVLPSKKMAIKNGLFFVILLFSTFGSGFYIHSSNLPSPPIAAQQNFMHHASSKVIRLTDLFPNGGYFSDTIRFNPVTWWLLGIGLFYLVMEFKKTRNRYTLLPLAFLVPLMSLPFYRNAYPYYYVFIMAPALLFCGFLPQRILHSFKATGSRSSLLVFFLLVFSLIGGAGFHFTKAFSQTNEKQMLLFDAIHMMFPAPVPYIDGCSAVASYPQLGFFMSHWGFEDYLAKGEPVFRRILQKNHPRFLLADTPHLDFTIPRQHPFFQINYDFFPEDKTILEDNFVPYWGMIWIPGKTLHLQKTGDRQELEILIPGPYLIAGDNPVILDDVIRSPGDRVILTEGLHSARSTVNFQHVVLRWADMHAPPDNPPPVLQTFYGF